MFFSKRDRSLQINTHVSGQCDDEDRHAAPCDAGSRSCSPMSPGLPQSPGITRSTSACSAPARLVDQSDSPCGTESTAFIFPRCEGGSVLSGKNKLGVIKSLSFAGDRRVSLCEEAAGFVLRQNVWHKKRLILIRHGRSVWNEMLGAHKAHEWAEHEKKRKGFRKTIKEMAMSAPGVECFVRRRSLAGEDSTSLGATSRRSSLVKFSEDIGGSSSSRARSSDGREVSKPMPNFERRRSLPEPNEPPVGPSGETSSQEKDFWRSARASMRRVGHVLHNATKLHQVDHSLSCAGLEQARVLRKSVAELVRKSETCSGAVLLDCKHWFVSPFLRALQTAAYALAPLYMQDPSLSIVVCRDAQEIMSSNRSFDCQGKPGNVGLCVFTRAVAKIALMMNEEEKEPGNREVTLERQAELAEVSRTLCAMDYEDVQDVWWKDLSENTDGNPSGEDVRIRRLMEMILKHDGDIVGLVAHSLLFQRIIQLLWPTDVETQTRVRKAMRNGTSADCVDPLKDKMMNCGTLVLTLKYQNAESSEAMLESTEIVDAEFLFDGRMESAEEVMPETFEEAEIRCENLEEGNYEDLEDFLAGVSDEPDAAKSDEPDAAKSC